MRTFIIKYKWIILLILIQFLIQLSPRFIENKRIVNLIQSLYLSILFTIVILLGYLKYKGKKLNYKHIIFVIAVSIIALVLGRVVFNLFR